MKVYNSITELVGNTPLLKLNKTATAYGCGGQLYGKLEYLNPAGSAKDRVAKYMIEHAERQGKLNKNSVIVEPTSGNTGIGIASIAASKGYRVILTMPETMSIERRKLLSAYGAEIVLTPGNEGMAGAVKTAEMLVKNTEGAIMAGQFGNVQNPTSHFETTGPEIWNDTDGTVDVFVAGIGTGGTVTGVGKYLKSKNKNVKIIGYEPAGSPFLTRGRSGSHQIQGIGAGFKPEIFDESVCDDIITVKDSDAVEMTRFIAKNEGLLVGISSGGAVFAAIEISKRAEFKGKNIVALLPDTGDRYLSSTLFE